VFNWPTWLNKGEIKKTVTEFNGEEKTEHGSKT
jgi:hypothetical protein